VSTRFSGCGWAYFIFSSNEKALLKGSCMINDEHTQVHGEIWLVEDVPPFRFFVS
jgi:hypothetical protein